MQRLNRPQRKVESTTEQLNPCFAIGAFAAMQPVDGTAPATRPLALLQGVGSLKRSDVIGTPWALSASYQGHTGYQSGMASRDQVSGGVIPNINRQRSVPRLAERRERTVGD